MSLADDIDGAADQLNRLCQKRIDPETFHVEKDAIVRTLRRLAGRARVAASDRKHSTVWRP